MTLAQSYRADAPAPVAAPAKSGKICAAPMRRRSACIARVFFAAFPMADGDPYERASVHVGAASARTWRRRVSGEVSTPVEGAMHLLALACARGHCQRAGLSDLGFGE